MTPDLLDWTGVPEPAHRWHVWVEGWALESGSVADLVVGETARFALHVVVDSSRDVEMLTNGAASPSARFRSVRTSHDIVARIMAPAGRAWVLDVGMPAFCERRALPRHAEPGQWVRMVADLEVDPTGDLYRSGAEERTQRSVTLDWVVEGLWLDETPSRSVDWGDPSYPPWLPDEGPVSVPAGPEVWRQVMATGPDPRGRHQGYKLVCRPDDRK